jgi:hypothetical protein
VAYGSCRDGLPENLPYEKRGTLEEKKLFQFHISKGSKRYKISHECAFSCLSSNSKRRESGGRGVSSSSARVWKTTSNDLLLILCINATKQTLQHRPVVFLNYQESTVCQFKKKKVPCDVLYYVNFLPNFSLWKIHQRVLRNSAEVN